MKTAIISMLILFGVVLFAGSALSADSNPKVVLDTSKGKIVLEL